jgi:hypothetical protein
MRPQLELFEIILQAINTCTVCTHEDSAVPILACGSGGGATWEGIRAGASEGGRSDGECGRSRKLEVGYNMGRGISTRNVQLKREWMHLICYYYGDVCRAQSV